jgi:hypothetical protein
MHQTHIQDTVPYSDDIEGGIVFRTFTVNVDEIGRAHV